MSKFKHPLEEKHSHVLKVICISIKLLYLNLAHLSQTNGHCSLQITKLVFYKAMAKVFIAPGKFTINTEKGIITIKEQEEPLHCGKPEQILFI